MKTNRTVALSIMLTSLSVVIITFIFTNSAMDAEESTVQSTSVLAWLDRLLRSMGFELGLTDHFVRKTAHFVEFFTLGAMLSGAVFTFLMRINRTLMVALPLGLAVAVIDELIQLVSEGRSCEFGDMLLDFSAILLATAILMTIIYLVKRKKGYYRHNTIA